MVVGCCSLVVRRWSLVVGRRLWVVRRWSLFVGRSSPATVRWALVVRVFLRHWLLVAGRWSLVGLFVSRWL